MTTASATPSATRRIAKSYLIDLISVTPGAFGPQAITEQLLDRAVRVRHVIRADQLVLTFDLADDPAGWSVTTPSPAADSEAHAVPAADEGRVENRDYPGQPGERAPDL